MVISQGSESKKTFVLIISLFHQWSCLWLHHHVLELLLMGTKFSNIGNVGTILLPFMGILKVLLGFSALCMTF